jgi:alkanesulfonate monooxygenase
MRIDRGEDGMASEVLWYAGAPDGPYPWIPKGQYKEDHGKHLADLAIALDQLPFSGALVPTARHEPFIAATYLATLTKKFRPLIAVLPGLASPPSLANAALSFNDLFDNRLIINIINVETPAARAHGVLLDNDERYELATEYWGLFRRLVSGENFSYEGKYYKLENASLGISIKPTQNEFPLWFSGSSEAGHTRAGCPAAGG